MTEKIIPLQFKPGIHRDGAVLDEDACSDGEWIRFYRGKPRKMAGYRRIVDTLTGPVRKMLVWSRKDLNAIYSFSSSKIEMLLVDNGGVGSAIYDRTPSSGFASSALNMWTADTLYDAAGGSAATIVLAHCSQSLTNIDDDTATKPFYGLAGSGTAAFSQISSAPTVSGGVFAIPPYAVAHGSDGYVAWSDVNQPQTWSGGDAGSARPTGAKFVRGVPVRGSSGPGAVLLSLDSVVRMDYVGGAAIFRFTPVSTQSSVLSQGGVIEHDGVLFWPGTDRFLYYDGAVRELPNDTNLDYFFSNLNYAHRQKVWALKVPKWGEIWWFFPYGDATECDRAVIFNVREKCWYDAIKSRSAGQHSYALRTPILAGSSTEPSGSYGCYQHEFGLNAVVGEQETAIASSFTAPPLGLPTTQDGLTNWLRLTRVEPDFAQTGSMNMSVQGFEYANSPADAETTYNFTSSDGTVDMREQHRFIRLKFGSNEVGGDFKMGKPLLHIEPGDGRS